MSPKVGVSVEELSSLKLAVELSGSSLEQLGMGLRLLSQNAVDFSRGIGEAKQTFIDFGIGVTNADGTMRETLDIMMDFADVFADMEDGALKTAAAQDVFGRSGGNLIPLLNQGSDAIEEMMKRSEELGVVWSTEDAAAAAAFNDSVTELSTSLDGLEKQLGTKLIPALTDIVDKLTEMTLWANANADAIWEWGGNVLDGITRITPGIATLRQVLDLLRQISQVTGVGQGEGPLAELGIIGGQLGPPVSLATIAKPKKKRRGRAPVKREEEEEIAPFEFLGATLEPDLERMGLRMEEERALIEEANLSKLEQQRAYWDEFNTMEAEGAETQIEINRRRAENMQALYNSLGQGLTSTAAKTMAALVTGQKMGGQQLVAAFGSMLGDIIGKQGEFHVQMGLGAVARGFATWSTPNTAVIAGGLKEIAQGTLMKGLSFLGAGGGGAGGAGGGGGGGGFVGGGVLAGRGGGPGALPGQEIPEVAAPATEGSAILNVGHFVEQLKGHVVIGDLGDIATALIPGMEEVIKRDNITFDVVGT
jgi:hypothetical protein